MSTGGEKQAGANTAGQSALIEPLGADGATIAAQQAELQRSEAKRLLNRMFDIPDGYGNEMIDRIVDCIIGAALLEMVSIQSAAQKQAGRDK